MPTGTVISSWKTQCLRKYAQCEERSQWVMMGTQTSEENATTSVAHSVSSVFTLITTFALATSVSVVYEYRVNSRVSRPSGSALSGTRLMKLSPPPEDAAEVPPSFSHTSCRRPLMLTRTSPSLGTWKLVSSNSAVINGVYTWPQSPNPPQRERLASVAFSH
eukprot:8841703-Pyramimonas_sp.AAC.1